MTLRDKSKELAVVVASLEKPSLQRPEWMRFDEATGVMRMAELPLPDAVPFPVEMQLIVEYYSKRLCRRVDAIEALREVESRSTRRTSTTISKRFFATTVLTLDAALGNRCLASAIAVAHTSDLVEAVVRSMRQRPERREC